MSDQYVIVAMWQADGETQCDVYGPYDDYDVAVIISENPDEYGMDNAEEIVVRRLIGTNS